MCNFISFKILPTIESNDHEVRILIDGNDLLGDDYLGLDPPAFFMQKNLFKTGELMIGRCTCGCEGCSDYPITVYIDVDFINWTDNNGLNLQFEKADYEKSITEAKNNYSWEDVNRRVERFVTELLKNTQTKESYTFDWASARIKEDAITLSYSKNGDQKLFELPWDSEVIETGITNAKYFLESKLKRQ